MPPERLGFAEGFGHDVAGCGGESRAFELNGYVFNRKLGSKLLFDGGEDFLALVHVHVGNARVAAQRIVIAAERPDVHVVNFGDVLDG